MAEIKWSQWSPNCGLIRCGRADLRELMRWMADLGRDAKQCLQKSDKSHALYGRKIYDGSDLVSEIRFYCDTYFTDDELDNVIMDNPHDVFYVAHK